MFADLRYGTLNELIFSSWYAICFKLPLILFCLATHPRQLIVLMAGNAEIILVYMCKCSR
jgi:hypothetical protein